MNRINGFTLIEALIVLAILAIVASLGYPSYAGHIVRAKRIEGQLALVEAMQRQERHFAQHNTYFAFSADATDVADALAPGTVWWSGPRPAASAYELDGHACEGGTLADCVEIRARPGTARVDARFRDPACGALTLDSAGRQGAQGGQSGQDGQGGQGAAAAARCWP